MLETKAKPQKVLIIIETSLRNLGGIETWAYMIANRLIKQGLRIEIVGFSSNKQDTIRVKIDKVCYIELKLSELSKITPLPKISSIAILNELIKAHDNAILVPTFSILDLLVLLIALLNKKKILIVFQNPPLIRGMKLRNIIFSLILKHLINRATSACIVLNPFHFMQLRKMGVKTKIHIVPQGVDIEVFTKIAGKYSYSHHLKMKKFIVLFLGRLTKQKGIEALAKSIEIINNRFEKYSKNMLFIIGGPISLRDDAVRKIIDNIFKYENVKYLGAIPRQEVPKVYLLGHVFIYPSIYEGGFPLAALEAQASGLPVIISNLPEVRWILKIIPNPEVIHLIKPNDPEDLVNAIIKYFHIWLKDRHSYITLIRKSKENARIFSWDVISSMYLNIINKGE